MTRIVILADIHGNLPAFEAALQHVAQQRPDLLLLAGDIIIGSPDSQACWQLARSLGCPILRGNHERYAAHYGTPKAAPLWSQLQFAPLQWSVAQLSEQERQQMEALPLTLRLPEAPGLFFAHASERDDHDTVAAYTPEEQLHGMFPAAPEPYLIRAHNHYGQVRVWQNRLIVTCGSVGLPLDSHPTAQYLLLDQQANGWKIQHMAVPYPLEATLKRFHDTGYLEAVGPMARLFYREVLTASHQIVPCLRLYAQWSSQESITFPQAVERFLSL